MTTINILEYQYAPTAEGPWGETRRTDAPDCARREDWNEGSRTEFADRERAYRRSRVVGYVPVASQPSGNPGEVEQPRRGAAELIHAHAADIQEFAPQRSAELCAYLLRLFENEGSEQPRQGAADGREERLLQLHADLCEELGIEEKDEYAPTLTALNDAYNLGAVTAVPADQVSRSAWVPLHKPDGYLSVEEGQTYWFAIQVSTNGGPFHWEYFADAVVWDAETEPDWSSGEHGFDLNDEMFCQLPAPPDSEGSDG